MAPVLFTLLLFAHPPAAVAAWGKAEPSCAVSYAEVYGPSKREAERLAENGGYLPDLPGALLGDREERNMPVLEKLRKEPPPKNINSRRIIELDAAEVDQLFAKISENPQVKDTLLCDEHYRGSKKRGFCFGRAVAAHLQALQFGVHNKSVRKLWAVGRLEMDGEEWKYHVTTIVRGKDGWWALDPSLPYARPMPVAEWYEKMKVYDPGKKMRLYATPAKRFSVQNNAQYNRAGFTGEVFNGFFTDLLAEIRATNPKVGREPAVRQQQEDAATKKWLMGAAGVGGISAAGLYELYRMNRETP